MERQHYDNLVDAAEKIGIENAKEIAKIRLAALVKSLDNAAEAMLDYNLGLAYNILDEICILRDSEETVRTFAEGEFGC